MSHVWEHSICKGSQLLLLLAIADHANDEGIAWPGIESLAAKTRMSRRQTITNIQALVSAGELKIVQAGGTGPKSTNLYQVATPKGAKTAPSARVQSLQDKGAVSSKKGAVFANKGAVATAPEPSLTVNEPPEEPLGATDVAEPAPARRLKPVPDDFTVDELAQAWAVQHTGLSLAGVEEETEMFVAHHKGQGTVAADWSEKWRVWMMRVNRFRSGSGPVRPGRRNDPAPEDEQRGRGAAYWFGGDGQDAKEPT